MGGLAYEHRMQRMIIIDYCCMEELKATMFTSKVNPHQTSWGNA